MSTLDTLSEDERFIVTTVRDFVTKEVQPVVQELEHTNTYPEALIEQMKELGIFDLAVPEGYGGTPVSTPCYVLITEELARGWMSLAGAMGATPSSPSCCCTSAPRSRSSTTCRRWPPARSARPWR